MNIHHLTLGALVILTLSACDQPANSPEDTMEQSGSGVSANLKSRQVAIQTAPFASIATPLAHNANASALAQNNSVIKAQINAKIEAIHFDAGAVVKKGAVLVSLNCDDAKAQRQQAAALSVGAQARAKAAKDELARSAILQDKDALAKAQYEQRDAEYKSAQSAANAQRAALSLANNQVARCEIRAPFDGVVSQRFAQVGELASYGLPMLQLTANQDIIISAHIAPAWAASLQNAQKIEFVSNNQTTAVRLVNIVASIDIGTNTQEARLKAPKDANILAGNAGRLHWQAPELQLPARYLSERDGKLGVFIAENQTAKFIPLANAQAGRATTVDFDGKTLIITAGFSSLNDQQPLATEGD